MRIVPCLAALLLAAACASPNSQDAAAPGAGATAGPSSASSATSRSALASPSGAAGRADASGASGAAPSQRTVYFDYDSSDIKPEYTSLVQAYTRYMSGAPGATLRIEGNCDERGSREYNLALGERRAQALKRALTVLGVPATRIETVSYGEEKPAAPGHDEAAWAKNRRDELVAHAR